MERRASPWQWDPEPLSTLDPTETSLLSDLPAHSG